MLTEQDIIRRMLDALKQAGQAAFDLAPGPRRGPAYGILRDNLVAIEGCCRQLAMWRGDYVWLNIGVEMHTVHEMAGNWIRGVEDKTTGQMKVYSAKEQHPLFLKLGQKLAMYYALVDRLLVKKTGMMGARLPTMPAYERQVGAPVQVKLPPRLILPPSVQRRSVP
ncbi:MAG: hypothetical protein KGL39_57935 [Patescibacteria group bacterium]|nr:hypothetical protein [Patescibacteria group bacterium]